MIRIGQRPEGGSGWKDIICLPELYEAAIEEASFPTEDQKESPLEVASAQRLLTSSPMLSKMSAWDY